MYQKINAEKYHRLALWYCSTTKKPPHAEAWQNNRYAGCSGTVVGVDADVFVSQIGSVHRGSTSPYSKVD